MDSGGLRIALRSLYRSWEDLVDATADSDFIALAQLQSARGDGTAGRVNMVDNISAGMKTAGKFGWKAQVPTLFQFAGDAYLNEMGITSPEFPNENCPQGNCAELALNFSVACPRKKPPTSTAVFPSQSR